MPRQHNREAIGALIFDTPQGFHQDLAVLREGINRDDRIRTCGPFVPNEVRYQTAPHPGGSILKD